MAAPVRRQRVPKMARGTERVAKAVLIASVPPLMLKTPVNPGGTPFAVFDKLRVGVHADRSQLWKDLSLLF
jgi:non-heme chloroperoxidase